MKEILTVVQEAINKYGENNIFMVSQDYHGLYHDDYCKFEYYNNITGEFFKDEWSTAYAAPAFGNFECKWISEALEEGLINKEKLFNILKEQELKKIDNSTSTIGAWYKELDNSFLRVKVDGGRKWKGIGFLVCAFNKSYQWGVKLWRSDNDYGTSTTTWAKVYDPLTNTIQTVNANYVQILDHDKFQEMYKTERINRINKLTPEDIITSQHGVSLKTTYIAYYDWLVQHGNKIDLSTAIDVEESTKQAKRQAFKDSKMSEIIEWVKNNTDKKGDEIIKLAEHIFNKKY